MKAFKRKHLTIIQKIPSPKIQKWLNMWLFVEWALLCCVVSSGGFLEA